jgi:TetR/AcrR family transcriptional regulator
MDDPAGNKERIASEATRLFSERGYEGVGVGEICEVAGITKPTLYHYFGSKRGLLDAIVEERGRPLLAAVREASRWEHDVPKGLERMAFAMAGFAVDDPLFSRMRLAMSFAPPESESGAAAAAFNLELFGILEEFFRLAAQDHGNMRGRQKAYAVAYLGTINSYIGFFLGGATKLDEATIRGGVRQFMYGIFS